MVSVRMLSRLAMVAMGAGLLALAAAALSSDAAADNGGGVPAGELAAVDDCWEIGLPHDASVDCAMLGVPADHDDPGGDTFELAVAIIRTDADDPADPVVRLSGGPGGRLVGPSLAQAAANPEMLIGDAAAERDLVLIDQRGVGLSEPTLACPEVDVAAPFADRERMPTVPEWWEPEDRLRAMQEDAPAPVPPGLDDCFERLDAAVDLSVFTTAQNADDLSVLREALADDAGDDGMQVALYGVSYGAKLALTAADRAPDAWSAVVLSSPLTLDRSFFEEMPASYDDTLDRLDEACAGDPTCATRFAEPRASLDEAVEQLSQEPAVQAVPDPGGGEPGQLALDGVTAANLGFQVFYQPVGPQPAVIDAMAEGRVRDALLGFTTPQPLPQQGQDPNDPTAPGQSAGMLQSFVCAEEVAYADLDRYADDAQASPAVAAFAGAPLFGQIGPAVCDVWNVPAAQPDPFEAADTDTPLLVVTGGLDQITPPSWGEQVAEGAENAQLVEVPAATHGPAEQAGACGAGLVADFLAAPEAEVDDSCATASQPRFHPVLSQAPTAGVARVGGADRYDTAARLSGWSFPQGAATVYVASGQDFPDALSGGASSAAQGAPMLLTERDALPAEAVEELARLAPQEVVVVGGEDVIADAVVDAIGDAAGAPAERLAGADRYETAAALSAAAADPAEVDTVYLATGESFPDALAGGALAGTEQAPLLLSRTGELSAATADELARLDPSTVVLLGGTAALDGAVEAAVADLGIAVTRVGGADRYETAALVAERTGAGFGWAFTASGEAFPDALAGTPVAAGRGPLLLVEPDAVSELTEAALAARSPSVVGVFGGSAAVAEDTAVSLGRFAQMTLEGE